MWLSIRAHSVAFLLDHRSQQSEGPLVQAFIGPSVRTHEHSDLARARSAPRSAERWDAPDWRWPRHGTLEASSSRVHDDPSDVLDVTHGGRWLGVMARTPPHLLSGGNHAPPVWLTHASSCFPTTRNHRAPPARTRRSSSLGSDSCRAGHPATRVSAPLERQRYQPVQNREAGARLHRRSRSEVIGRERGRGRSASVPSRPTAGRVGAAVPADAASHRLTHRPDDSQVGGRRRTAPWQGRRRRVRRAKPSPAVRAYVAGEGQA
jgi:hypothetical protein